jgi:hypothetical protein
VTEVIVVARLAAMCGFIMLGCPNSNKKKFIFITLTTLFSKKNIKFKVALRPRLGLKPMVISVSNHGRRVVKSGTPSSTSCVWAVTSLVHSKHLTDMVTSADSSRVHET